MFWGHCTLTISNKIHVPFFVPSRIAVNTYIPYAYDAPALDVMSIIPKHVSLQKMRFFERVSVSNRQRIFPCLYTGGVVVQPQLCIPEALDGNLDRFTSYRDGYFGFHQFLQG